ncbi:MAG: (2Fe-2S)-binding protein [Marivibrio sp.]|uniref:(2Fe-2S)-binding protein n=1 Tax=Marivibrio sp. TaxID=2039719 RepID=UPI0032ED99C0
MKKPAAQSRSEARQIVCTCMDMTRADFVHAMTMNQALDFDQLLAKTGAGTKCTACCLDLETIYTEEADRLPAAPTAREDAASRPKRTKSLVRRAIGGFLSGLDRVAPPYPMLLRDYSPVVAGEEIVQSVMVANDRFLFGPEKPCSPVDVNVLLRDSEGREVQAWRTRVPAGEAFQVALSPLLMEHAARTGAPLSSDGLTWGAVEVRRRWVSPALRGTTRPQLLIEAPGGNGGVHTQGPSGVKTHWYTAIARPMDERVFVAVTNAGNRILGSTVPHALNPDERRLAIPPFGARGVEVDVNAAAEAQGGGGLGAIAVECDGLSKTHIISASRNFDRMAIDHPAES